MLRARGGRARGPLKTRFVAVDDSETILRRAYTYALLPLLPRPQPTLISPPPSGRCCYLLPSVVVYIVTVRDHHIRYLSCLAFTCLWMNLKFLLILSDSANIQNHCIPS